MHKPRIIFFDIDGTLIDMEKKRITERTLDALRRLQQNGILLAIATGRSPLIVPKFDGVEFDVFLTYNGSFCYNMTGDIFVSPIPPQDVQTLIQNAAALGRPVSVAGRTQLLSNGTDDDLAAYYAIGGRAPVISDKFDEVSRGEVFQLLMGCRESPPFSKARAVQKSLPGGTGRWTSSPSPAEKEPVSRKFWPITA